MFKIILVVFMSSNVNVADTTTSITLAPESSIELTASTAKGAASACERVRKALAASNKTAFCGEVVSAE